MEITVSVGAFLLIAIFVGLWWWYYYGNKKSKHKAALGGCNANNCPGSSVGTVCSGDGAMSYSCCTSDGKCGCTQCGDVWNCSPSYTGCY